jgi:hypothetical protein
VRMHHRWMMLCRRVFWQDARPRASTSAGEGCPSSSTAPSASAPSRQEECAGSVGPGGRRCSSLRPSGEARPELQIPSRPVAATTGPSVTAKKRVRTLFTAKQCWCSSRTCERPPQCS